MNKIRCSKAYDKFMGNINDTLEGLYHQMFGDWASWGKSGSISFYDDDMDLYLSIGECSIAATITFDSKMEKPDTFRWLVRVVLIDEYNFEYWDNTKKDGLT